IFGKMRDNVYASVAYNAASVARGSAALAGLSVAALAAGSMVAPVYLAFAVACTLLFLVLNRPLFGFLRCARGIAFAAACVPLHLLYHLVVAAAGAAGLAAHVLDWQPQAT
ncbi:MAG: hypothetical protein ACREIB_05480, partial [Pseudomonadota bacterium]